jgi:hypothetical protein
VHVRQDPELIVDEVIGVSWAPFDVVGKAKQEDLLTNTYVEAFRQLAPEMGAYVNEVGSIPNFVAHIC